MIYLCNHLRFPFVKNTERKTTTYTDNKMSSVTFEEIKKDRERSSKWLLVVAWGVEICAASIGFYFAAVTAQGTRVFIDQYNIIGSVDANIRLAMLPFVIVGLVELTKIPLAYAFYHARVKIWRAIFLITLIFLCVLTTETVFTGMERNLNNQMFIIADDLTEQEQLSEEIKNVQNNIKEIQAYDLVQLEDDYNKAITNISKDLLGITEGIEEERQTRNDEIDKQISDLQKNRSTNQQAGNDEIDKQMNALVQKMDLNQGLTELIQQRDLMQTELTLLQNREDNLINMNMDTSGLQLEIQMNIISSSTEEIANLNLQEAGAISNSGVFGKNAIISSYAQKRGIENQKITNAQEEMKIINSSLQDKFDNIRSETYRQKPPIEDKIKTISDRIQEASNISDAGFDTSMKSLTNQRIDFNQRTETDFTSSMKNLTFQRTEFNSRQEGRVNRNEGLAGEKRGVETASYQREKANIETRRAALPVLEESLKQSRDNLTKTRKSINDKSEQIQVLRFAKRVGGHKALADVQPKDINLVMIIWFGSISLIAAVAGTVIAFASFLLKDKEAFTPKPKLKSRSVISNSLRRLIISRRRFYNKDKGIFTRMLGAFTRMFDATKERMLRPVIKVVTREVPTEQVRKEIVYVPFYSVEGGTLDISSQIKGLTDPEEIKKKIDEITSNVNTNKKNEK